MMKVIAWIVGLLVLLVVGVGAYLVMFSGSIVKDVIEQLGPDYLGTSVSVDAVDLSLTEGSAGIRGLSIGNPAGFEGTHAMRLGEAKVVLDPSQISETLVVIKQVLVDGADVAAVARGQKTNFQKLLDNITASTGGASEETAPSEDGSEMKFIIERFDFTNAKASLESDVLGAMELSIPDIRLTEVGRKTDGVTAVELAEQLLKPISSAITQAAVKEGVDIEGAKQRAREKITEKIEEKLPEGLKGLTDKLKFNRD
jgi:uncharacterized protein involved in outer membrane biogenesis